MNPPSTLEMRWCPEHGLGEWDDALDDTGHRPIGGHWVHHPDARSCRCEHNARTLVYTLQPGETDRVLGEDGLR